jgi:hypothetical protein
VHTTSTFFNMFVTSVFMAAVKILQGPVNHILGLQIHVRIFLQHGRTNEANTGMKSQMCWKGDELCWNNGLYGPETACPMT